MNLSEIYEHRKLKKVAVKNVTHPEMNKTLLALLTSCLPVIKQLNLLSEESRRVFVYHHPPVICELGNGQQFIVVGNLRSLEIARSLEDAKTPCLLINQPIQQYQVDLLLFNELMNLAFFSLDGRLSEYRLLQFRQTLQTRNTNMLRDASYQFAGKQTFCELFGINRRLQG